MAHIDATNYGVVNKPDPQLGSLFERHKLPADVRIALCNDGFHAIDLWHALGDSPGEALTAVTAAAPSIAWPPDNTPARAMLEVRLKAVFQGSANLAKVRLDRVQKLEDDPNKLPTIPDPERVQMRLKWTRDHPEVPLTIYNQPHDRFMDRLRRDFLVNGRVPMYALEEIRVKSDTVTATSGFRMNVRDLIEATTQDDRAVITSTDSALNRIKSLYVAIAMLNIMPATMAGSLGFFNDLVLWSSRHAGLDMIIALDSKWRQTIDDYLNDHAGATFQTAFDHVRSHGQWIWDSAVVDVGMSRIGRQQPRADLLTPDRRPPPSADAAWPPRKRGDRRKRGRSDQMGADSGKASRADSQPQARSAQHGAPAAARAPPPPSDPRGGGGDGGKAKGKGKGKKGKDRSAHTLVTKEEWTAILKRVATAGQRQGKAFCRFFMSTAGCNKSDACPFTHECPDCAGQVHAWAAHHYHR